MCTDLFSCKKGAFCVRRVPYNWQELWRSAIFRYNSISVWWKLGMCVCAGSNSCKNCIDHGRPQLKVILPAIDFSLSWWESRKCRNNTEKNLRKGEGKTRESSLPSIFSLDSYLHLEMTSCLSLAQRRWEEGQAREPRPPIPAVSSFQKECLFWRH